MSIKSMEDLIESNVLCNNHCPLPVEVRGMHLGPNGPYGCEGCKCDEAYADYRETQVAKCEICNEEFDLDDMCEVYVVDKLKLVCDSCASKIEQEASGC